MSTGRAGGGGGEVAARGMTRLSSDIHPLQVSVPLSRRGSIFMLPPSRKTTEQNTCFCDTKAKVLKVATPLLMQHIAYSATSEMLDDGLSFRSFGFLASRCCSAWPSQPCGTSATHASFTKGGDRFLDMRRGGFLKIEPPKGAPLFSGALHQSP